MQQVQTFRTSTALITLQVSLPVCLLSRLNATCVTMDQYKYLLSASSGLWSTTYMPPDNITTNNPSEYITNINTGRNDSHEGR